MAVSDSKVTGRNAPHECPECGKVVKGGGGLYGHLLLAHGIRKPRRETRLAQELAEFQAMMGWKEQEWANERLAYEKQITGLKQQVDKLQASNAMEEYLAGEQQRADSLWKQAKCHYCGNSVGLHKEVTDSKTGKKGFMCP